MFTFKKRKSKISRKEKDKSILRRLQRFISLNEEEFAAALMLALTSAGDTVIDEAVREVMEQAIAQAPNNEIPQIADMNTLPSAVTGDIVTPMVQAFEDEPIQSAYENAMNFGVERVNSDIDIDTSVIPNPAQSPPEPPAPQGDEQISMPSFSYADAYNAWCSTHCGELIVEIDEGQRRNVQNIINDALQNGRSYQDAAREIRRVVGLTERQAAANRNYRNRVYEQLLNDNPNMKPKTAQKKADAAAERYAEKQRRQRANNIARTELAKAQTQASIENIRFLQQQGLLGPMHGVWITSGRDDVCEICRAINHKIVDLEKDPLPPLHPQCRCAIMFEEGEAESEISFLRNISPNDYAQYVRYSNTLGEDAVGSIDNFVDLKYNNTEKWSDLKYYYRGINNGYVIKNAGGRFVVKVKRTNIKYKPNRITQITNAKGGIDRNFYDNNGDQVLQISNNGHGHKKEESMGVHGEHAHDCEIADNIFNHGEARELTDLERKENANIL